MSPANTSAICSVTASGRPAASAAPNSDERISPEAIFQRISIGAGAVVAVKRSPSRTTERRSPPPVANRSVRSRPSSAVSTVSGLPGRSW